jgi:hypothetical protein
MGEWFNDTLVALILYGKRYKVIELPARQTSTHHLETSLCYHRAGRGVHCRPVPAGDIPPGNGP